MSCSVCSLDNVALYNVLAHSPVVCLLSYCYIFRYTSLYLYNKAYIKPILENCTHFGFNDKVEQVAGAGFGGPLLLCLLNFTVK